MDAFLTALPALGIYLAAVVSPGPNFVILTRTTLHSSRKAGLLTALGFSTGAVIYVSAGFIGITAFIRNTPWLYNGIQIAGGLYLIYIGTRMLLSFIRQQSTHTPSPSRPLTFSPSPSSPSPPFLTGLITMLTNPKAGLLMLTLFTSVIDPQSPAAALWIVALGMPVLTLTWHGSVALFLSRPAFQGVYRRFAALIESPLALVLIFLGARILFAILKTTG